eukprot:CAMPEP_0203857798 /NCGR_PEP_ID=MMETSP0359-20131031/10928_1 /ASSEMBLY_ACC=CAM_ASM_000338 /TAXON_ID=268821 /ORGANISM="Scrippsiella Hangoei, Strain SHTV-5" /LENGTH=290 /DNA_ID=CAMNT_0050774533 /DNA_START=1676 /DNA_END=2551 /DNA_ORIENTATION=+
MTRQKGTAKSVFPIGLLVRHTNLHVGFLMRRADLHVGPLVRHANLHVGLLKRRANLHVGLLMRRSDLLVGNLALQSSRAPLNKRVLLIALLPSVGGAAPGWTSHGLQPFGNTRVRTDCPATHVAPIAASQRIAERNSLALLDAGGHLAVLEVLLRPGFADVVLRVKTAPPTLTPQVDRRAPTHLGLAVIDLLDPLGPRPPRKREGMAKSALKPTMPPPTSRFAFSFGFTHGHLHVPGCNTGNASRPQSPSHTWRPKSCGTASVAVASLCVARQKLIRLPAVPAALLLLGL